MNRGYVLVVDDDALLVELAVAVLQQEGYETMVAHNGKEALKLIDNRIPHLILLDANMPLLNGFEVLAALKANSVLKRIPVVMLTSRRSESDIVKARQFRVDGYIAKPFEPSHLLQRVATVIQVQRETGQTCEAQMAAKMTSSVGARTETEFLD